MKTTIVRYASGIALSAILATTLAGATVAFAGSPDTDCSDGNHEVLTKLGPAAADQCRHQAEEHPAADASPVPDLTSLTDLLGSLMPH
jgi:hypothetical protein